MPIYEYKCNLCGEISEVLLKSMSAQAACSHCDSTDLTKLISAPAAVITRGSSSPATDAPAVCPNKERCGVPNCPAANG